MLQEDYTSLKRMSLQELSLQPLDTLEAFFKTLSYLNNGKGRMKILDVLFGSNVLK
jgi:hypothetical protein